MTAVGPSQAVQVVFFKAGLRLRPDAPATRYLNAPLHRRNAANNDVMTDPASTSTSLVLEATEMATSQNST
jgi:hypothetical protein